MFKLACADTGAADCAFVTEDATMEGLLQKVKAHVWSEHPETKKKMLKMTDPEIMDMIRPAVKTV